LSTGVTSTGTRYRLTSVQLTLLSNVRYLLPAFTVRQHGPCSRVVLTGAREHGPWTQDCPKWHPCWTPVFTARRHGSCLPSRGSML